MGTSRGPELSVGSRPPVAGTRQRRSPALRDVRPIAGTDTLGCSRLPDLLTDPKLGLEHAESGARSTAGVLVRMAQHAHSGAWQTASTLFPSGSRTNAP